MTKKLADKLKEIAEADDFPETLKTSDLKGKTVNLLSVRTVETENGLRFIGNIELDGQHPKARPSGSIVQRPSRTLCHRLWLSPRGRVSTTHTSSTWHRRRAQCRTARGRLDITGVAGIHSLPRTTQKASLAALADW